jgi:hypothetical protein
MGRSMQDPRPINIRAFHPLPQVSLRPNGTEKRLRTTLSKDDAGAAAYAIGEIGRA